MTYYYSEHSTFTKHIKVKYEPVIHVGCVKQAARIFSMKNSIHPPLLLGVCQLSHRLPCCALTATC